MPINQPGSFAAVFVLLLVLSDARTVRADSVWEGARAVSKDQIRAAMDGQRAQGYTITAISNSVRLQVGVFLALVEQAKSVDRERRPLRVGHAQYFAAFLETSGLQAATAPPFATVPYRFGEDYLIDYRIENVIEHVDGASPARALNVKAGWPADRRAPASYSYEDKSTQPTVEVTHAQVNAYRILDYGDLIVYDDIRGVTGRATSGVLGLLFDLVGTAQAVQTRFGVAPDGVQVSRTTARKLLTLTQTVTIDRHGRVVSGIPDGRADLADLEKRLKALDVRVRYVPFDLGPVPPDADAER